MICSVYDTHRRCYDFYEVPGTSKDYGARGTKYRAPTQAPQGNKTVGLIGFAPEALAMQLPPGAQHVGTGEHAKGIICESSNHKLATLGSMPTNLTDRALTGLSGFGEVEPAGHHQNWMHVVGAAVVAGVVGVVVQNMLNGKSKKTRRS